MMRWRARGKSLRRAASTACRTFLLSAMLLRGNPGATLRDLVSGPSPALAWGQKTVAAPEPTEEELEAARLLLEAQAKKEAREALVLKVKKIAGAGAVAGVGAVVLTSGGKKKKDQERKQQETEDYLRRMSALEQESSLLDGLTGGTAPSAPATPAAAPAPSSISDAPGSLQQAAKAASPAAPPPPKAAPKGLKNLFAKREAVTVPTVDELTATGTPEAELCKTLAWALRAPMDLRAAATAEAGEGDDEDIALALSILEQVEEAKQLAEGNALASDAIAKALEQVARAMLLQKVDDAIRLMDAENGRSDAFKESAAALCAFTQNAGTLVLALGVGGQMKEVVYDGLENKKRLEKLYASLLGLAAPELLATMGMGADDDADVVAGVGLDTVELLRPALKVREGKGQRMVQDVVQQQMMELMGGDEGNEAKAMARSVAMLEQLIEMGNVQPEDLASLKDMIAQSMGMPVDELLARREELSAEMPPEGQKLFELIEKLFGDKSKAGGSSLPGAAAGADAQAGAEAAAEEDDGMKVTIREKKTSPDPSAATPAPPAAEDAGSANVSVRVKKKEDAPAPVPDSLAEFVSPPSPPAETSEPPAAPAPPAEEASPPPPAAPPPDASAPEA